VCSVALTGVLCLCAWVAHQWYLLSMECKARALLERAYPYPACIINTGRGFPLFEKHEPTMDLRQLEYGRLYVPVENITFSHTTVRGFAFEQIAHFSCLERLDFQDCRIDQEAMLALHANPRLTNLEFWHTPITLDQLQNVATCVGITHLVLDGTNFKGDWLRGVSCLAKLENLVLNNADLTDGATNSLGRMKQLTWLQLSHAKIDSTLGPALASLEKLECLNLGDTSFDDKGTKDLIALKRLTILSLRSTDITDNATAALANLPNLRQLVLDDTKVGDKGVRRLSKLQKLATLDIRGTLVTNSCLPILAAMPSLQSVLVNRTRISESAPGFVGFLEGDIWYPNQARAKEVGSCKGVGSLYLGPE